MITMTFKHIQSSISEKQIQDFLTYGILSYFLKLQSDYIKRSAHDVIPKSNQLKSMN